MPVYHYYVQHHYTPVTCAIITALIIIMCRHGSTRGYYLPCHTPIPSLLLPRGLLGCKSSSEMRRCRMKMACACCSRHAVAAHSPSPSRLKSPSIMIDRPLPKSTSKRSVRPTLKQHHSKFAQPDNGGTPTSPRISKAFCFSLARLAAIIPFIGGCMCRVGPPPLHFEAAFEQDCQGDVEQWHWDRCALPGSVIWTAMYFGHRQKSESELSKAACLFDVLPWSDLSNCRNSSEARWIIDRAQNVTRAISSGELNFYRINRCSSTRCQPQYTALNADQPWLISTRPVPPLADSSLNLLPPLTLSLYIENEDHNISKWSWWQPSLTFSLAVLNCADGAQPYHEWTVFTASFPDSFRCCKSCPYNHFPSHLLRLHANNEYLLDDIFLGEFTLQQLTQLNAIPCSPFRASLSAKLLPSATWSLDKFPNDANAHAPITWHHRFHAATRRLPKVEGSRSVRRRSANAISHKLCETHGSYPNRQAYDARTHTVSTSFSFDGNRSLYVVVLAASVKHTGQGRAVFEALVWAEYDNKCGPNAVFLHHCVGQRLDLAVMCRVAGRAAPGVITQDVASQQYREAVVSCDFPADLFKRNTGEVLVDLSDSTKGFSMMLPMCSLAKGAAVRKLVACTQPIYNAKLLEKRWPGVLQAWVMYHVRCAAVFQ